MTVENVPHIELVNSLREQLKLQQAINCQFEVDLEARDELVSMLQTQVRHSEEVIIRHGAELEQRRAMMKALAHTVAGLEKLCHNLEDELERSREESRIRFEITRTESEHSQNSYHMVENSQNSQLVLAEEQIEELTRKLKAKEAEFELLDQERQYALEDISRFKEMLRKRDAELEQRETYVVDKEREAEELRTQASSVARGHAHAMDEQKRLYNELEQQEVMTRSQMENAIKAKAEAEVMVHSLQQQTSRLTNEIQALQRQVHDLQQESAGKEVKIVQLNKLHQQDQEDKAGLNLALDSKQQELELIKRKLGVRSISGSTPAYSRTVASESSTNRRGSLGFTTPLPRPRPSSAIGISHTGQVTSTPFNKDNGQTIEDTSNQSTVKPNNKIGLSVARPSPDSPVDSPHHSSASRPPNRYLKSVNGAPSTSTSRDRRSSVASTSSITSGSEKENSRQSRTNSRLSIPA